MLEQIKNNKLVRFSKYIPFYIIKPHILLIIMTLFSFLLKRSVLFTIYVFCLYALSMYLVNRILYCNLSKYLKLNRFTRKLTMNMKNFDKSDELFSSFQEALLMIPDKYLNKSIKTYTHRAIFEILFHELKICKVKYIKDEKKHIKMCEVTIDKTYKVECTYVKTSFVYAVVYGYKNPIDLIKNINYADKKKEHYIVEIPGELIKIIQDKLPNRIGH